MLGFSKPKIITDQKLIDEILDRGVENVFPSKEFFKKRLLSGDRLTIYLGIDPTGPSLHLGHVIPLKKLSKLQKLGHKIILLIGDFTAMIGDPTDKSAVRKKLSRSEVLNNLKKYKTQASKIITFGGNNPAELKFNSKWLSQMPLEDVLELASMVTVEQMLKREMFQRRMADGKPVYLHEFIYPLMQGFDSVAMDVDAEIGGNDQTFNMLVGRDLLKIMKSKEKIVIATKLLVDQSGSKMGKTEGNMVSLDQNPAEMFGKVMSWGDNLIIQGFEILTDVPQTEIEMMESDLKNGANPKELKTRLAFEIVKLCHGENEAAKASQKFENTFKNKEFPEDTKIIEAGKNEKISEVLTNNKIVGSKSEFRRLIEAGAITDHPDQKISDPNEEIGDKERKLKIGKKAFVILRPKN